ncbi:MAG TPA: amino acid permease [Myxococcales bacterium]|nr:amino acid permease [Myxococcales bacterium]
MSDVQATPAQTEPSSSLGLFDSTTIVAGSMIGSGIFLVSADIARLTGSPGWLLLVWLFAGLLTVAAALSYGELAAMMPHAGGQYVYLREAFGPAPAFLFGWTQATVIQTGTIAAVAVAFARFLGVLVPSLTDQPLVGSGHFTPTPQRLVAIVLICLLTWSNSRGLSAGKLVQNVFTVAKWLALVALVGLGVVALFLHSALEPGPGHAAALAARPFFGDAPLATLGPAMVGALFAADAWNNITFTAGEVRRPGRTLPAALALGTGMTIALYLLVNVAYLAMLPLDQIAHAPADRVASAAVGALVGPEAAALVAVGILVSTFGCVNGIVLAGARVSYAMARDGLFFRPAGSLNARGVPGVALWMQAAWAGLLCLSGTYSELLDYVIFAVLVFYVLTLLGLFALRRSRPEADRPYRAFGYPVLPAAYVIAASAVALSLLWAPETRTQALAGLGCVLVGVPVYLFISKRRTNESPVRA